MRAAWNSPVTYAPSKSLTIGSVDYEVVARSGEKCKSQSRSHDDYT